MEDQNNNHPNFQFNPYDSDTFPDQEDDDLIIQQMEHFLNEQPPTEFIDQHIQTSPDNPSIFQSDSIELSRQFIQQVINNPSPILHNMHTPGLVILPIQDFNLIRNDTRNNRVIRHIIVFPTLDPNFERDHFDFTNCLINFYN